MRRCKIPVGCKRSDKPCCADCEIKACPARCENSPQRCNCWEAAPPPRARERKVDSLRVAYLYSTGMGQKEIAFQLGCCRNTVSSILRELGVGRYGQA